MFGNGFGIFTEIMTAVLSAILRGRQQAPNVSAGVVAGSASRGIPAFPTAAGTTRPTAAATSVFVLSGLINDEKVSHIALSLDTSAISVRLSHQHLLPVAQLQERRVDTSREPI